MKRRFPVRRLVAALAVILAVQPAEAFFRDGGGIKEGDHAPVFSGHVIDKDRKIGTMFGAMVLPTTLVIDVTGKVRFFHVGYRQGDEKQLRSIVAQAVKEIRK